MLHDTSDPDFIAVPNRIHLQFNSIFKEKIEKHRIVRHLLPDFYQTAFDFLLVDRNAHPLTAENVAGANKDRIANPLGRIDGFLDRGGHSVRWIWNFKLFEDIGESAPIFREVHILSRCTYNWNADCFNLPRQLQRRLATELYDDTYGLLVLNDVLDLFPKNGLKVQLVGDVEISRDGLGIAVDHDGLVAHLLRSQ